MSFLDTLNYFIQDQQGNLQGLEWDIREETNQEEPQLDWYCEEYDATKQRLEDLETIKSELDRLRRYDDELSSVMPDDYKDWWQGSKEEWPLIAKSSIESLREREEIAWEHLAIANKKLEVQ